MALAWKMVCVCDPIQKLTHLNIRVYIYVYGNVVQSVVKRAANFIQNFFNLLLPLNNNTIYNDVHYYYYYYASCMMIMIIIICNMNWRRDMNNDIGLDTKEKHRNPPKR